jgi:hypothetical protein
MENVFKDVRPDSLVKWLGLVLFIVSGVVLLSNSQLDDFVRGALALVVFFSLVLFFGPSLVQASQKNHEHVVSVCVWSFVLVVAGIATSIYAFFAFAGDQYLKYDKFLNLLPVVLAIWAAAAGWLVHFKVTTKAHRTNNAFSIIMETRKNTEFLKRNDLIAKHFPPGTKTIPEEYRKYFCAEKYAEVARAPDSTPGILVEREKAEAVRAMKFVLSYYEFMAIGIKAKDLDEKLIFDTLRLVVIAQYKRARPLVDFCTGPDGDCAIWCELKELVERWDKAQPG